MIATALLARFDDGVAYAASLQMLLLAAHAGRRAMGLLGGSSGDGSGSGHSSSGGSSSSSVRTRLWLGRVEETASLKGRPFLAEPAGPRSLCQLVSLVAILEAAHIVLSAHSQRCGPDARLFPG